MRELCSVQDAVRNAPSLSIMSGCCADLVWCNVSSNFGFGFAPISYYIFENLHPDF